MNLFDFDELETARQFTLLEHELYKKIRVNSILFFLGNKKN